MTRHLLLDGLFVLWNLTLLILSFGNWAGKGASIDIEIKLVLSLI